MTVTLQKSMESLEGVGLSQPNMPYAPHPFTSFACRFVTDVPKYSGLGIESAWQEAVPLVFFATDRGALSSADKTDSRRANMTTS